MLKDILKKGALGALCFLAGVGLASLERTHAQDYAGLEASPALWTVEADGATVHLFGTFHLLPDALDWRSDVVDAAFAESGTVWFEADVLSPEAQAQMQALVPQLGLNQPGVTLSSLLGADTYAALEAMTAELGIPAGNLEPVQPWLAGVTLGALQLQSLGFNPASGVEAVLTARANGEGKAIDYLETAEGQLRMLSGLSMDTQIEWLRVSLEDMSDLESEMDRMVRAWATGDADTLDTMVNGSIRDASAELYDALMVNRNRDWVPQIEAMIASGGTHFVAVGAGHLPGEEGVVALLRAEGYTVTRR
ncbi:MAG: TraB/GumN family protein [Caulobacterales bacterium]|uniref:TraB/GumN family protein n=1 Tax=Glycocaulis sp. TaxID=1969725 RepID=UPI003F9F61D4